MCVTNTTHSRVQAVSLTPAQVGLAPSLLSQRLLCQFGSQSYAAYQQQQTTAAPEPYISTAPEEKPRPKRRRKPQKPGKTAKMNDRHFVVHNYHDHSSDPDEGDEAAGSCGESTDQQHRRRGGVSIAFPIKLHAVLDQVEADGLAHVVSWQAHGRCFIIHKPKEFVEHIMPKYFRQTKLTSFQRQLNLYGFQRLTRGPDASGYYHELFLRGRVHLCKRMTRTKVKGTKFKAASSPENEPDFYALPPVQVTPHNSDEERSLDDSHRADSSNCFSAPSYVTMQQQDAPPLSQHLPYATFAQPQPSLNLSMFLQNAAAAAASQLAPVVAAYPQAQAQADHVLDEAVDELFINGTSEIDSLAEFVHDWDPNFGAVLEDDTQLGFMLDKLLED